MAKLIVEAITASKLKGDIITKTLDTLNSGYYSGSGTKASGTGKISASYQQSKELLSAVYQGKGAVVSTKG